MANELVKRHMRDQRRRGLAESTITNRIHMLQHLADWVGARGLLKATTEDIESFLDSRRIGMKTRYTYISNLHSFYQWAVHVGELVADPTAMIVRPRVKNGLPRPISDRDLALALDMARGDIRVMICCAAYQGMRCIEIARLARTDILEDQSPPLIVARGKGDKPRPIPMHEHTWRALQMLPMPRSGPILHWDDGRPLQAWKVSQLGNEFLHGIGLDATMHRLRHWFGTSLYRTSGRDLLLVRDLMGHSSITTTTIYAAFDRDGAEGAVAALEVHPVPVRGRDPTIGVATALRGAGSRSVHTLQAPDATEGPNPDTAT